MLYTSERSIDGILSTDDKSLTITNSEPFPWLEIELETERVIEQIFVLNRIGCCGEQLANLEVRVGNTPIAQGYGGRKLENNTVAGVYAGPGLEGETVQIKISPPLSGRYISLQLLGTAYLQVEEVYLQGGLKWHFSKSSFKDFLSECVLGWSQHEWSLYKIVFYKQVLDSAEEHCASIGAELAWVDTLEENQYLYTMLETSYQIYPDSKYWVGNRLADSTIVPDTVHGTGECVLLAKDSTGSWAWHSTDCSTEQSSYSVCQKKVTKEASKYRHAIQH